MEKNILGRVNAILYRAIKEILIFSGLALIALTFAGVITRYVLKTQMTWAYEISILLLVWVCFLGAAAGVKSGSHVNFDAIIKLVPPGLRRYAVILKYLVIFVVTTAAVIFGYKVVIKTMSQQFQTIPVPVSSLYAALPAASIPLILFYLEEFLSDLRENFGPRNSEEA
jgi:TRAP-type C4-dicarboxylate transport system permease small subunit